METVKSFAEKLAKKIEEISEDVLNEEDKEKQEILKEGENIKKVTHTYTDYESKMNTDK